MGAAVWSHGIMHVEVIIPALDEAESVGDVVAALLARGVDGVVVADNGSRDDTAEVARVAGARVVTEPRRGYGAACLRAMAALRPHTDVVVFADADGSDDPADLAALLRPLGEGAADFVVGSRVLGEAERGALSPPQRLGNALATTWLRARFDLRATDLGPFRAIRRAALEELAMTDPTYGWTVEMQIKAARRGLRYAEVPVRYRSRRTGRSKVSGSLRGTLGAGLKIIGMLAYHDVLMGRASAR